MFEKKYTMDDASWYEYLAQEKAYLDQNSRENWAKREKEEKRKLCKRAFSRDV